MYLRILLDHHLFLSQRNNINNNDYLKIYYICENSVLLFLKENVYITMVFHI